MVYDFNSLMKQADEASNRDKFYTDFEDVDPNVLHQITELTEWMRTKAKGSDVREVIAQLFERTWLEESKEGNANMEVAKARGRFPVLNDRLNNADSERAENARKLAQKANKDEVTNVMTPKGTLAYASLPTSGNQVGWYYYCPDGDGSHGAGNYVWNGTSWFFGGTGDEGYNLLKGDLTEIDKDIYEITFNKFDYDKVLYNKMYILGSSNSIRDSDKYNLTELIDVSDWGGADLWFKAYGFTDYSIGYRAIVYCFDDKGGELGKANTTTVNDTSFSGEPYKCKVFKLLSGTKKIRVQYSNTLNNYNIGLFYSFDWHNEYVPHKIMPFIKKEAFDIGTTKYYDHDSNMNVASGTNALGTLSVALNSALLNEEAKTYRAKLYSGKFSHDGTMVVDSNGNGYVAYVTNAVDTGDSPTFANAITTLAKIDLKTLSTSSKITNLEVCKRGDIVEDKTILSGVGAPNCVIDENIIYIIFSAKLSDNKWYLLRREYNSTTSTFGNIEICTLNGDNFTTDKINEIIPLVTTDYFISMNAQIAKTESMYYAGVNVGNYISSGFIVSSSNLKDFTTWYIPNVENSVANFECPCYIKDGYLFYAIRQSDINKMILLKISLSNKTITDITEINDARSRAWWFEYNNKLYLAHSANGRNLSEFIEINEARLANSEIVLQSTIQMIYPCICEYDGNLFISATGNSSTSVYVRKFVMPTINTDIVTNVLLRIMKNYRITT